NDKRKIRDDKQELEFTTNASSKPLPQRTFFVLLTSIHHFISQELKIESSITEIIDFALMFTTNASSKPLPQRTFFVLLTSIHHFISQELKIESSITEIIDLYSFLSEP
ncbi:9711_t:CDS:2, partial [Entrophospora sp. SA101]